MITFLRLKLENEDHPTDWGIRNTVLINLDGPISRMSIETEETTLLQIESGEVV